MPTIRPEYVVVNGDLTLVTVQLCRERVAQFRTALDELALLPDGMGTGKRSTNFGGQRAALTAALAAWNARLWSHSHGSEGRPFGLAVEHV